MLSISNTKFQNLSHICSAIGQLQDVSKYNLKKFKNNGKTHSVVFVCSCNCRLKVENYWHYRNMQEYDTKTGLKNDIRSQIISDRKKVFMVIKPFYIKDNNPNDIVTSKFLTKNQFGNKNNINKINDEFNYKIDRNNNNNNDNNDNNFQKLNENYSIYSNDTSTSHTNNESQNKLNDSKDSCIKTKTKTRRNIIKRPNTDSCKFRLKFNYVNGEYLYNKDSYLIHNHSPYSKDDVSICFITLLLTYFI